MTQTLHLKSPAKLNLMLHITGRQENGYHNLQTVFQFIDLCDDLGFTKTPHAIRRISGNTEVDPEQDLIVRAARLLQEYTGSSQGVDISIQKKIPVGGGLGGGSSDAATTLMALNHLWQLRLKRQDLQQIGLKLGADVPVFIFGRSAWAEGVGEDFQALKLPEPWYLIIHPKVFVSTKEIFSSKHLTRDCHPITIRAFLDGDGNNVCQPVACSLYPEIQQALNWLSQFSPARMTGTGSCIYAIFDSAEKANIIKSQIPGDWTGYLAKGMNINPVATACFDAGN